MGNGSSSGGGGGSSTCGGIIQDASNYDCCSNGCAGGGGVVSGNMIQCPKSSGGCASSGGGGGGRIDSQLSTCGSVQYYPLTIYTDAQLAGYTPDTKKKLRDKGVTRIGVGTCCPDGTYIDLVEDKTCCTPNWQNTTVNSVVGCRQCTYNQSDGCNNTRVSGTQSCDDTSQCPCTYGDWQDTSSCPSCGTNETKTQKRTATASCGGEQMQTQSVPCNIPACPTCNYGEWSTWSGCSKPCNGGIQTRTRTQNPVGDIQCGDTSQSQSCNTQTCPPCAYSTSGTISNCSVQCGGGTQTMTYSLINANGNDNCALTTVTTQSCNTQLCPAIMNVITPSYAEYWNLYLSNNYNTASYFTSADYNKIDNSKISSYVINVQNAEQYRDNLVVGLFPLTIDIQGISLPYTVYYYYNNPANGVAKITNNGSTITSLQLNNNTNNFGTILNAIHFNANGVATIVYSQLYFLTSDLDTTDYYIYMILSKNPIVVQPQQLLSCTTKNAATCIDNNLGKNMAVAFTVNLKSTNQSNNRLQILGITTDSTGVEKCVFGAWICPNSNSLYLRRADVAGTDGVFSNCKVTLDIGLDCQIFILFNGNSDTYDIYKNGVLVDSFTVTSPPMYTTGKSYVFTSFNNYQTINGTLSNVVFLTSDYRTFTVGDLESAIQFMNTSNIFSQYQKTLVEGFSGYSASPITNYSSDYASYSTNNEIAIQNINNRNREYANQKKSEYTFITHSRIANARGTVTLPYAPTELLPSGGDLNRQRCKSQPQIVMRRDMLGSVPVPLYQDVSDNLRVRSEDQSEKDRQKINRRILELQNKTSVMQTESYNDIYANILWTGLATSIVYFLFVK